MNELAIETIIQPKCNFFGTCGGCSLQNISHGQQLNVKQDNLVNLLLEKKIHDYRLLSAITGPIWGYRGKARLSVKYVTKKSKLLIGFREVSGRYVTDMQRCEVLDPRVGLRIEQLQNFITGLDSYREIPQIEVACTDNCTALVIRHLKPLTDNDINKTISFAKHYSFTIYLQPGNLTTIKKLYPSDYDLLEYKIPNHNLTMQFHPIDFVQVNHKVNLQMIDLTLQLLELNQNSVVLDLFCGIGNFTLPVSKYSNNVLGVDFLKNQIDRATQNAKNNNCLNAKFIALDLYKYRPNLDFFNKMIIDPPRSGAGAALEILQNSSLETLVYISCNPTSFVDDTVKIISDYGLKLDSVGIVDMFPHTKHVEVIAKFVKG